MMKHIKYCLWIICLLSSMSIQAKVKITSIWGDNMVLQQQSEVLFQGKASANKKIVIEASWNRQKIVTRNDQEGVTTTDAGSEKFIHPPYKIKVGKRLAYWALAKTYGKKGFLYAGPFYKSYQLKGNAVEISFEHGEEGLIPENQRLNGFELVDEKGNIVPAEAEIINGSARVKVWNDSILHPCEIRYCFRNYKEGNLFNNAEIPASPFRIVLPQQK